MAQEYVQSGRFLWNANMFRFTAGTMLRAMEEHCPDILSATTTCIEQTPMTQGKGITQVELEPECFAQVPENSIDYAVMEKSTRVAVVPCSIGWSDIGSWSALGDPEKPDGDGNRIDGGPSCTTWPTATSRATSELSARSVFKISSSSTHRTHCLWQTSPAPGTSSISTRN
jgi:mannose-1-phosphate guanylyltransferase